MTSVRRKQRQSSICVGISACAPRTKTGRYAIPFPAFIAIISTAADARGNPEAQACYPIKNMKNLLHGTRRPPPENTGQTLALELTARLFLRSYLLLALIALCGIKVANSTTIVGYRATASSYQTILPSLNKKLGTALEFRALEFPYADNLVNELIWDPHLEMLNLLTPAVARSYKAGWVRDLTHDKKIQAAAGQHQANIRSILFQKGKLIGLGLRSSVAALPLIQMKAYSELGFDQSDFPSDWDGLYEQVLAAAQSGHRDFFYPAWHAQKPGLTISFLAEFWNRGGKFLEPHSGASVLLEHREIIEELLDDWRQVWLSGAVPQAVLEQTYREFQQQYQDQNYAISIQRSETLISAATFREKQHKTTTLLPRITQPWGTPMTMMLSLSRLSGQSEDYIQPLKNALLELSLGSGEQRYAMSEEIFRNAAYLPVYTDYLNSERFSELLGERLTRPEDTQKLLDVYKHASVETGFWEANWYPEFSDFLQSELKWFLEHNDVSTRHTAQRLHDQFKALIRTHHY